MQHKDITELGYIANARSVYRPELRRWSGMNMEKMKKNDTTTPSTASPPVNS